MYHIDGNTYEILRGTREDVWNGKAYQTTGGVPKSGLIINKSGKIVSKVKSVEELKNNKFETLLTKNAPTKWCDKRSDVSRDWLNIKYMSHPS